MRISRLEDGKAGRLIVYLEDGTSFPVSKKDGKNLDFTEGRELSQEQLNWIFQELVFPRGRNYLIYLLSSKDYTTKEIEGKLKKAFYPDQIIEQIICYGIEKHYLDDERYAQDYIRLRKDGKSVRQLMYQLQEKGIPSYILNQISAEDEREDLLPKVQRYYMKKKGSAYERKARTYQYFVRKGYSSGLIRDLIRELDEE